LTVRTVTSPGKPDGEQVTEAQNIHPPVVSGDGPDRDEALFSEHFAHDPYPTYAQWRETAPVWYSERMGAYVVTRGQDVRAGLTDWRSCSQSHKFDGALSDALGIEPLVALNPPLHDELRRVFGVNFRPAALSEMMEPVIARAVDQLVARLDQNEPFELNRSLGKPLAMAVVSALIGSDNRPELGELYLGVLRYIRQSRMDEAGPDEIAAGRSAGRGLMQYLGDQRRRRVRTGGLDIVSGIRETEEISADLIIATCANLLVAGVETSTSGIATAMYGLLTHSEAAAQVRDDPSRARLAFDEGLRWNSPLQFIGKQVAEPLTLAGTELASGDELLLFVGSANRDSERYKDPDEYRIDRSRTDHLAFGTGIHLCLGAPMVRVEARTLINRLLNAFPDLRLDPDRPPSYAGGPSTRILEELWLAPR
jgi:cytochrome P450